MRIGSTEIGKRCVEVHVMMVSILAVGMGLVGCSQEQPKFEKRWSGTIQVQFYSPEGAQIQLRDVAGPPMEIGNYGRSGHRLERSDGAPVAVFDLEPGEYSLAYTASDGARGATLYGELELRAPKSRITQQFCRQTFVPLRLPTVEEQEAEHLFPSRDVSYTAGLEDREFAHLKQGDLITRVYFVADLQKAKEEYEVEYYEAIADVDRELAVLRDRETYLDVRYEQARRQALNRDPEMNIEDLVAYERFDVWGIEEAFIGIAKKRQELQHEMAALTQNRTRLQDERARRNALLRSVEIINRSGAMVLASPDLALPFHDVVEQVSDLGEVVAVLRIGGRHQWWGGSTGSRSAAHRSAGSTGAVRTVSMGDTSP